MKSAFKRILSLMAVMVVMASMAVPAFAVTCTWDPTTKTANGGTHCQALCSMYGVDVEGTNKCRSYETSSTGDYGYGITITAPGGGTETIYLKGRPDVNDVQVQMDANGRLDVYGMGTGDANTWNNFFAKYKSVIVGISGIGAITFIALFIMQFMKLGASAGNPQARSQALSGCLWTGIAAAALGAVSIIAGFFYNAV